ncbi:hypothetical protein B0T16DRAFT_386634 [Cercophora newfieldiana]|uniref:Uncharacterized protein n=1 Tax=Cercophora newfieldiana TaxID=92897 RepID=A0AA39YEG3_9PEZI|nr:hypothetical protein B0T16DRAFT_386634 [Cercophora newfieldiana]
MNLDEIQDTHRPPMQEASYFPQKPQVKLRRTLALVLAVLFRMLAWGMSSPPAASSVLPSISPSPEYGSSPSSKNGSPPSPENGNSNTKTISLFELIDINPTCLSSTDGKADSPLHCAIRGEDATTIQTLLSAPGANPNIRDAQLRTPLHLAVLAGRPDKCEQLLDAPECDPNVQDVAASASSKGESEYSGEPQRGDTVE